MGIIDTGLSIGIAITYNLLAHNIASFSYKDLPYNEKLDKTVVMLFIFGIAGYVISKFVLDNHKNKFQNETVNDGLKFGGILLIITAAFANWAGISEEMKILGIGGVFGYMIYYAYNKNRSKRNIKV